MTSTKLQARRRRQRRVRKKVRGTPDRPRLSVFRSNRHIAAQLVDDTTGMTLVAAASVEAGLRDGQTGNLEGARSVGTLLAERAKAAGIERVTFDRSGYRYHGRVAAVAEAAREVGLEL